MYNITNLTTSETIIDIVTYANTSVDGLLLGLLVLAVFFIMLFKLKKYDFDQALISSAFTCFILSSIGTYFKLLNFMYALFFLAAMAFTGFYMWVIKR